MWVRFASLLAPAGGELFSRVMDREVLPFGATCMQRPQRREESRKTNLQEVFPERDAAHTAWQMLLALPSG